MPSVYGAMLAEMSLSESLFEEENMENLELPISCHTGVRLV